MVRRLIFTLIGTLLMLAGLALWMDAGLYVTRAAVLDRLAVDPAYLDANSLENAATFNVAARVVSIADQNIQHPVLTTYIPIMSAARVAGIADQHIQHPVLTIYIPFASAALEKALPGTPVAVLEAVPTPSVSGPEQSSPSPSPTPSSQSELPLASYTPTPESNPGAPAESTPAAGDGIGAATASQEKTIELGQPIINLRIPALKINRAVIDIGLADGPDGMNWNTDRLFATRNRSDLVGHLEGSALPGEGGNIVLVGHNYDYVGNGVFVNLQTLEVGDKIILNTESGSERDYQVVKVKSVPYTGNANDDFRRHFRFLGPTDGEQLTLVSCGGANIGFFNRRVYVVAVPVS